LYLLKKSKTMIVPTKKTTQMVFIQISFLNKYFLRIRKKYSTQ